MSCSVLLRQLGPISNATTTTTAAATITTTTTTTTITDATTTEARHDADPALRAEAGGIRRVLADEEI